MRKWLIFFAILALLLAGCESSNLPPEPGNPGTGDAKGDAKTGGAIYYTPEGYAPPNDIFNEDKQIFFLSDYVFNFGPEQTQFFLDAKIAHEEAYVYKYGYYYSQPLSQWIKFQLEQPTVAGSNWIRESASTTLSIKTSEIFKGENYIVTYSCKKHDGEWKCGCRSENDCGYWMLNTFIYRNVDLPPEPVEPGSPITVKAWLYPNSEIYTQNKEVNLYLYLQTSIDLSDELDESIQIQLSKPDGTSENVLLSKISDSRCSTDEIDARFRCYVFYQTTYIPTLVGEYTLQIQGVIPEYMRLSGGSFKVYSSEQISTTLITQDINGFRYDSSSYVGWYTSGFEYLSANYNKYDQDKNSEESRWVMVGTGIDTKRWFDDWLNQYSNNADEVTLNVDGVDNKLYVVDFDQEEGSEYRSAEVSWLSGKKFIRIHAWARNQQLMDEEVIKAYVRKYPSTIGQDSAEVIQAQHTIEAATDNLNLYEKVMDVEPVLAQAQMKSLADGTFKSKIDSAYTQRLDTPTDAKVMWMISDDFDSDPALYLRFAPNNKSIDYKLSFVRSAESDVTSTGRLEDFEDNKLSILGRVYDVTRAILINGKIQLTLIRGSVVDTLAVGESRTYTVNGKDYQVDAMVVSGDISDTATAKLTVNGEITKSMQAGDTFTLMDGMMIGMKSVIPSKYGGDVPNLIEFYLDATKMVLDSSDMSIDVNDYTNIEGAAVSISSGISVDGNYTTVRMNGINIIWIANAEVTVPVGSKTTESFNVAGETDYEVLFNALGLNYWFTGLKPQCEESIVLGSSFNSDSAQRLTLDFTNKNGIRYSVPVYYSSAGLPVLGEGKGKELYFTEGSRVCENNLFIVESNDYTRVLQLTSIANTTSDKSIKLKDLGTGAISQYDFDSITHQLDIILNGYTYTARIVSANGLSPTPCIELIDITDDADAQADIVTRYGAQIVISNRSMRFIEKTQADDGSRDMFNLLIGSNLSIMGPIGGAPEFKMIVYDSDSQLSRGYTKYGSVITRDRNNPGKLIQITYPEKEAVAKVIVTSNKDFMEQSGEAIGCPVEEVPTSEGPIGGGGSSSSEPIPVSG